MDKIEKYDLKKKYIETFRDIYKDIAEDSRSKAEELIDKISSMSVTLKECEDNIYENGSVTEMCQGNYVIERESPWSKMYNNTIKSYLAVKNELDKMLPTEKESSASKAGEALASFVAKGKPGGK